MGKFRQVWASLGKFGQVWASLGKFGQVRTRQMEKKRQKEYEKGVKILVVSEKKEEEKLRSRIRRRLSAN